MVKISTIIPLYNCGDFIIRCLESLQDQGIDANEQQIIVVNDGSTDHGPDLVADYCLSHTNVKLYSQVNQGVSAARNYGLQYAIGEYVHFCDADDYLIRGGYFLLLNLSQNADCVKMSSMTVGDYDDINIYNNLLRSRILYSGTTKEYVRKFGLNVAIITTLFKRDFLLKNRLLFEPCAYGEDVLFNARCYTLDATVVFTDAIVYGYYLRATSVSRAVNKSRTERMIKDYIYITKVFTELKVIHFDIKDAFEKYILAFQNNAFGKVLRTKDANLSELKKLVALAYNGGVFPFTNRSFKDLAKNLLLRNPRLLKFISIVLK